MDLLFQTKELIASHFGKTEHVATVTLENGRTVNTDSCMMIFLSLVFDTILTTN